MDNQKNIIAAIALSSAILVLWALFFSPDQPTKEQLLAEKEKVENTETPKIEKTEIVKKISREDSIKSSDRIIFENGNIIGSISLTNGGAIDDFKFKKYNQELGSNKKIILLNPANVKNGYFLNTGWTTNDNVDVPDSKTVWKAKTTHNLTPDSPIKIFFKNSQGIIFERTISIDNNYLFNIDQKIINNSNRPPIIFPQGTRVLPDERPQLKKGAARIYEELKIPCQPVAINSGYVWPKKGLKKTNTNITISILKPIEPGLSKEVFLDQLQNNIYSELDVLD